MSNPAFGCVNNTIRLRSNRYFDLADPQPDQFELSDIAGALSKICRFGGQCRDYYSVAEHSFHCSKQAIRDGLSTDVQIAVLLHDAAEAFIGDCVKPLKVMLPQYSEVERMVEAAIAARFQIDFNQHADHIREIDHAMLIAERKAMFSKDGVLWTGENQVRDLVVWFENWGPCQAEAKFLSHAKTLGIRGA